MTTYTLPEPAEHWTAEYSAEQMQTAYEAGLKAAPEGYTAGAVVPYARDALRITQPSRLGNYRALRDVASRSTGANQMTADKGIELCAKALGWTVEENGEDINGHPWFWVPELGDNWNPRHDQADSDRMGCDLEIETRFSPGAVVCWKHQTRKQALHDGTAEGRRAALREARAQVAAEMGRVK